MAFDKGDRVERAARGMFVGAFALACSACGDSRHHGQASAGNANMGGSASAGSAGAGGDSAAPGDAGEGGAFGDGGRSGEGGAIDVGMAGEGATHSAGTNSGGMNAAGDTSAGGTSSGAGGTSSGAGGTSSGAGGTSSGAGGTSSGAGGTSSGAGGTSSGAGGTSSGAGGTSSGAGGTSSGAGGTSSGAGGTSSGAGGTSSGAGGTSSGGVPGGCGDAVVEASEECDDGNAQNLDGCNAGCRYEVVDRMTTISVQGVSAPAYCSPTTNVLGRAFSSVALTQINTELQQSISSGTLNNLLHWSGLEDPSGASNDSSLAIGFLPGFPDIANGPWPGGTPLDFWFRVRSASVDAQGVPLSSLLGTLTARSLDAGPGLLKLPVAIGGAPSTLSMSNARLRASINATPAPNVPAPPPGALAPGLTVFQSIAGSGAAQGICGNVTVESLAHIPVPTSLANGAASACLACTGSRTYTACSGGTVGPGCNSMLDVLVGGCKTLLCFLTVVTPAQPDVPAPGNAAVLPLSLGTGNAVPSSQSTGNADAYSSYFKFDANRAHITGLQ